jgi:hypothetical protein
MYIYTEGVGHIMLEEMRSNFAVLVDNFTIVDKC